MAPMSGGPALAGWSWMSQCAVPMACQTPFRSGFPSKARGTSCAAAEPAASTNTVSTAPARALCHFVIVVSLLLHSTP